MVKKFHRLVILKLKIINFTAIKVLFFKKDIDIEEILVSSKISSGKKKYKYFIYYLYNNFKVKLLHIMLPKTSTYVKGFDGETKWMHFLIEDDNLLENIVLFGIKSVLISKKNLTESLSIIKCF